MDYLTYAVKSMLLPPGLILAGGLVAFYGLKRRAVWGKWVGIFALLFLYLFSAPFFSNWLLAISTQSFKPLTPSLLTHYPDIQAIVILGAGRRSGAAEYGGKDTVSLIGLERLRYGVRLHRQTGLPILVTGGGRFANEPSEAALMAEVLEEDFGAKAKWQEHNSQNTFENAYFTWKLLKPHKINKIFLVTDGWHMQRSVTVFRKAGFYVIPAPMGQGKLEGETRNLLGFLPQARALLTSQFVLHELLGQLWYGLRGVLI